MEKEWFELKDFAKKNYSKDVWIPLYSSRYIEKTGMYGCEGFKKEYLGSGSLLLPVDSKEKAIKCLDWSDAGIDQNHNSFILENQKYKTVHEYINEELGIAGSYLVFFQNIDAQNKVEVHLNLDLVFALGLVREGNSWFCPHEGYTDVVRVKYEIKGEEEDIAHIEIRAEYLRDYLCARNMGLFIASYKERVAIVAEKPCFKWENDERSGGTIQKNWFRYISQIHEGGNPYGKSMLIMHSERTDVDFDEDIPNMDDDPSDENIKCETREEMFQGKKLYRIGGEYKKTEWIEPLEISTRVRGDEEPAICQFITDASGKTEDKNSLKKARKWLFFKPSIINELLNIRGGFLNWCTAQTGKIGCVNYQGIYFGINPIGIINVYAKDIAMLPNWQQKIWMGNNIAPDGGVCNELLCVQVSARPVSTQAPEAFILGTIYLINNVFHSKYNFELFLIDDKRKEIILNCHRFRCTDFIQLCALAKDLFRISGDSINLKNLKKITSSSVGQSLKTLEYYLGTLVGEKNASKYLAPFFAIHDLRCADAHIPSKEYSNQLKILNINVDSSFIYQGYQMLYAFISTLSNIHNIILEKDIGTK